MVPHLLASAPASHMPEESLPKNAYAPFISAEFASMLSARFDVSSCHREPPRHCHARRVWLSNERQRDHDQSAYPSPGAVATAQWTLSPDSCAFALRPSPAAPRCLRGGS